MEISSTNGNGDRIKIHERLAALETQVSTILLNHLPHIQKAIDNYADTNTDFHEKMEKKMAALNTLLISNLVAIIISMTVLFFKK